MEFSVPFQVVFASILAALIAIPAAIDASNQAAPFWIEAGYRRSRWMWQAAGVVVSPVVPFYTGLYLFRVRPRLVAAQRKLDREWWAHAEQFADLPARASIDPAAPRRRVLRPSLISLILSSGPLLVFSTFDLFVIPADESTRVHHVLPYLALVAIACLLIVRQALVLTDDQLVVRNIRATRVPWSEVRAITADAQTNGLHVTVWMADGRRLKVRSPVVWSRFGRRRLARDFRTLTDWWMAHR